MLESTLMEENMNMKKLTIFILAVSLLCLLTGCTDGGNVSDRTDGIISESTVPATRPTEAATSRTEAESSSVTSSESNGTTNDAADFDSEMTTGTGSETGDNAAGARGGMGGLRRY